MAELHRREDMSSPHVEDYEGMLSIESTTNKPMKIMLPKRGNSTEK